MIKLEGTKALSRKLSELGKQAGGKALRDATRRAMLKVRRDAKANAPVGDRYHKTHKGRWVNAGFLKKSVAMKTKSSRDKTSAIAMVGVKPEAYYGLQFIELGTSSISKAPWLQPAFDKNKNGVLKDLSIELKKGIVKARKK